jgi:hypothetical protein
MTNLPDDQIDPYEPRLARRVGTFAEQAVRPIDPLAVAAAAHVGARRQTLAGRLFGGASSGGRLGIVLVGALVTVAALGVVVGAGGGNLFAPTQTATANVPEATPTAVPGDLGACTADELGGTIAAWEGAAGHRIATVQLRTIGKIGCSVPELLRPALVDADDHALIVGAPAQAGSTVTIAAGRYVTTLVDMANYCGDAPTAALHIRLYLPSEESVEAAPAAGLANPVDAPPCSGSSVPSTIEMQPLQP